MRYLKKVRPREPFHIQTATNIAYSGTNQLSLTEDGLRRYSTRIVKLLNGYKSNQILDKKRRVLEFGAGSVYLAELWLGLFGEKVDCVEIDLQLCEKIRRKGFNCQNQIIQFETKFDLIYTSNVLEHIETDVEVLKEIANNLKDGGIVAIYVPAFPFLYSAMDSKVGHVRRYQLRELKSKMKIAGFNNIEICYSDSLGFFASLALKYIGYQEKTGLGSLRSLLFYDKFLYPISIFFDFIGFRYLFGKNILAFGMKLND